MDRNQFNGPFAAMSTFSPNNIYRSRAGYESLKAFYDALLSQWPVDYETYTVSTRHGATHVIASGPSDGPPLVLLHGGGVNSAMWGPNIASLSSIYRTYCIDIIGEGNKSAPTRLPRRGPEHVDWLMEVLDGLNVQSAHVAGLSLGGWLTLQTAAHVPDRVRCAIAMSPVAFERMRLGFVLRGMAAGLFPSRRTVAALIRYIAPPKKPVDPEFINAMLLIFKTVKANTQQPSIASDADLCRITAPTLVIVGEHEVVSNPHRIVARAKRLIPHVKTEIVAGAGHGVASDQPEIVNNLILQFLKEHSTI